MLAVGCAAKDGMRIRGISRRGRGLAAVLSALGAVLVFSGSAQTGAQQPAQAEAVTGLLAQGSSAMQHGDLPAAESAFAHTVAVAPNRAEAQFGLGLVLLREGAVDRAIAALAKAVALDPRLGGAHMFLGIAQYQAGQAEAALPNLRAELAMSPDNVEALTWMGMVALGSDQPEMAVPALDYAVALKGNDPLLLYYDGRAHAQMAAAAMARLYKLDPDSVLVHRALAESYADANQPEKAVAEYGIALGKQPGNPELLESLGEQQLKLSRFEEATKTYRAELAINPNSAVALYNVGRMDVEHGHPQEGVAVLRKAVEAHARAAPAEFYLGYGLAQMGQNAEAAHWLEQSLASQPPPFIEQSAYFQLARVYEHLGRKEDAQKLLDRLKQLKAEGATSAVNGSGQP